MPTMSGAGPVPGVAGVSTASASMHSAGPAKLMPCDSLRTDVTSHPRLTRPSAMGPTNGVMSVMDT